GVTGLPVGYADEEPQSRLEGLTANGETDAPSGRESGGVLEGFETTGMGFEEPDVPVLSVEIDTSHEDAAPSDRQHDDQSLLEDPFLLELAESAQAPDVEPVAPMGEEDELL